MLKPNPRARRAAFYQDPERPGQARHYQCLTRAGVNPVRLGYLASEGPCWVCETIAEEHRRYQDLLVSIEKKFALADALLRLSDACFALAKDVRCATGMGRVERWVIESEAHAEVLSFFRAALADARSRAHQSCETVVVWYRAEMPPESGTFISPARFLVSDPTQRAFVSIMEVEARAGSLAVLSRGFSEDAKSQAARAQVALGKDPDDLALILASQLKASLQALAEVIISFARPLGRLTEEDRRKAEALAQRWRTRACRTRNASTVQPMTHVTRIARATKRDVPKASLKRTSQRREKTPI